MKRLRVLLPIVLVFVFAFTACTPETIVETVEVVKEVEVIKEVEVVKEVEVEAEKGVSGQVVLYTSRV